MANVTDGARFEQKFCRILAENGFWVHRMSANHGGQQPADVIAMHQGTAYLIDCKVCKDSRFRFERMEPNQRSAMDLWLEKGGVSPMFALQDGNGDIWMLDYGWAVAKEESGVNSILCAKGGSFMRPLDEWLEWVCG